MRRKKDLKAFLEDLATNESLAKKFEGIKKSADIVALAKEEGYEFTKKEYDNAMLEMVSGGGIGDAIWGAVKQGAAEGASAVWNSGKEAFNTTKDEVMNTVTAYFGGEEITLAPGSKFQGTDGLYYRWNGTSLEEWNGYSWVNSSKKIKS